MSASRSAPSTSMAAEKMRYTSARLLLVVMGVLPGSLPVSRQLAGQPRLALGPVAIDGRDRQTDGLRGFFNGQSAEDPQRGDLGGHGIVGIELDQERIQVECVELRLAAAKVDVLERHGQTAIALFRAQTPSLIDQ